MNSRQDKKRCKEKILLILLPYWTPQIPPLGIACLKSFLGFHGCDVTALDLNTDERFDNIYNSYFECLTRCVPYDMRGNFKNIGHDVLRNHLMAHLNYSDEKSYMELVDVLIWKTFFVKTGNQQISELNDIIRRFYIALRECVQQLLEQVKPTVLGLSVFSGTLPASLFTFKCAKETDPDLMTVMGGGIFADQLKIDSPDFNFFLEKVPYIDKIIAGEGEILFLKLLRDKLPARQRVFTIADVDNQILDLSAVDIPDFSDFVLEPYPYLSAYASRSCPFQCNFCSETVQWGKYRKKSANQISEELLKLYRKHGSQLFLMGDSLLNPVVEELAGKLIATGTAIYWDGYLRVDQVVCDEEKTLHWRRGGFYRARLGLESGSPGILEKMGKKISPLQIRETVKSLAAAGIKTTTYWVVGYPEETEADFLQTLALIEELKDDIYEAECNPFNFFLSGQVNSDSWVKGKKIIPLYPEKASDMLIIRTWVLVENPSREETYSRIRRFVKHCERLSIPNPYSLNDIRKADERWKRLHKNAVPSLLDFKKDGEYIDECREVKRINAAGKLVQDHMTFQF